MRNALIFGTRLKNRSTRRELHFAHAYTGVSNNDTVRPSGASNGRGIKTFLVHKASYVLELQDACCDVADVICRNIQLHNTFVAVNYVFLTVVAHP